MTRASNLGSPAAGVKHRGADRPWRVISILIALTGLALAAVRPGALSAQEAVRPGSVQAEEARLQETAAEFYLRYRAAFEKATRIEDVLPYLAAANRKQVEATPQDERARMFAFIKMIDVTQVKVIKEERTAAGATLTAEGLDPMEGKRTVGTVQIRREDGAWKVGEERWGSP